jgi:PKHD-type hydroxylase
MSDLMGAIVHNMYWCWEEALSKEFCNAALAEVDWVSSGEGLVNPENPVVDSKMRRTDVIWQPQMQPLGCIARMYIETANQLAGWGYLIGSQERTQLGRYKSSDEGHYDWHVDAFAPKDGVQRKLSISILLSDPSEFEGGELQFKGIEDHKILTKQGSIVVFPSFIEHRVAPVTKGVRYSAVTWASGPSFK